MLLVLLLLLLGRGDDVNDGRLSVVGRLGL